MEDNVIELKQRRFIKEGIYMCKKLQELRGKTPQELLQKYDMQNIIPVDVNKLLKKLNITSYEYDYTEIENKPTVKEYIKEKGRILGTVMLKNDDIIITYKKTDSNHRKRFTLAHELAHCCIDETFNEDMIQFRNDLISSTDKIEIECNKFAGELLIPQQVIELLHQRISVFPLERVAQFFDVSVSVMAKRLDNLKIPYVKLQTEQR